MKSTLHSLLLLANALGAPALAQDTPPSPPPPGEPARPDGDRPRSDRRPDGDRRPEGGRRPEGERSPGGEGRRGPGPADPFRGETERDAAPQRPWFNTPAAPQQLRPYLGVVTSPAPAAVSAQAGLAEGFGLVVDDVLPESPAKAAGIERFDVLAKFEDQKLVDSAQLAALVRASGKDQSATITLLRKGQEQKVTVKIAEKMLAARQPGAFPQIGDLWNRYGDAARRSLEPGGPLAERAQDATRRAQEGMRDFQRRMQEFQEKAREWAKDPKGKFPEMPRFPSAGPTQPPPGPLPGDVIREVRPGGAPEVQRSENGTSTTWNTASANVTIKDESGEIEVRSDDGHRNLVAKDAKGAVIFNGPIDTEEQRRALPEGVRRKLDQMRTNTRQEHREPPREGTPPPRPPGGGEVQ